MCVSSLSVCVHWIGKLETYKRLLIAYDRIGYPFCWTGVFLSRCSTDGRCCARNSQRETFCCFSFLQVPNLLMRRARVASVLCKSLLIAKNLCKSFYFLDTGRRRSVFDDDWRLTFYGLKSKNHHNLLVTTIPLVTVLANEPCITLFLTGVTYIGN